MHNAWTELIMSLSVMLMLRTVGNITQDHHETLLQQTVSRGQVLRRHLSFTSDSRTFTRS
jgi:hypothetical protein